MTEETRKRPAEKNAFEALMQTDHRATKSEAYATPFKSNRWQRNQKATQSFRRTKSVVKHRVICPSCEKSLPKSMINLHLDQCIPSSSNGKTEITPENQIKEEVAVNDVLEESRISSKKSKELDVLSLEEERSEITVSNEAKEQVVNKDPKISLVSEAESRVSLSRRKRSAHHILSSSADREFAESPKRHADFVHQNLKSGSATKSVFASMMERSKSSIGADPLKPIRIVQSFHLSDTKVKLCVRWQDVNQDSTLWSTMVHVKDREPSDKSATTWQECYAFEIKLSSKIDTNTSPVRLVRHHSRLSVPVLKSVLQKAIRRRRPLPAVRVAMELADKALGELLRRLPIIILEDATLHRDMDFLIWMMMAVSKGFVPSRKVLQRVFEIVFEVASCPWLDSTKPSKEFDFAASSNRTSLTTLFNWRKLKSSPSVADNPDALVWALLVRAEYGGTREDIELLRNFADLWNQRFASLIPTLSCEQFSQFDTISLPLQVEACHSWLGLIDKIYEKAKVQSFSRVPCLCLDGLYALTMSDVSTEGVDFHCSKILDDLMSDTELCGIVGDLVLLANTNISDHASFGDQGDQRQSMLKAIFRTSMWKYSSSVNCRRPLLTALVGSSAVDQYGALWKQLIEPKVAAYQNRYVEHRLAKR